MKIKLRKPPIIHPYDWTALATYNAEVARGIVHTPEWKAKMAARQETFNRVQCERLVAEGTVIIGEFQAS